MTALAGYGETYGQARVLETFQTFLAAMDQNASQLKLTDAKIGEFLNFFLEQHEGGMPSELDMEENSEPDGTSLSLPESLKCPMADLQHPATAHFLSHSSNTAVRRIELPSAGFHFPATGTSA